MSQRVNSIAPLVELADGQPHQGVAGGPERKGSGQADGRPPRWRRDIKGLAFAYAMIAVPFGLLAVFGVYPFLEGVFRSFFRYNGGKVNVFIGMDNYVAVATDPLFWHSVRNVLLLTFFGLVMQTVVPLLAAWMVHHFTSERLKYAYRILVMVPAVVPTAVFYLVWKAVLDPTTGALNSGLRSIGLGALAMNWLRDPSVALIALMLVGLPWLNGLFSLLFLSTLGTVPREQYEAAQLDGAGRWMTFLHVEMPHLSGQTRIVAFLLLVAGIQAYDSVYILTGGGPHDATMVPGVLLYKTGFDFGQFGMANAIGVSIMVLTLSILGIGLLIGRLGRQKNG